MLPNILYVEDDPSDAYRFAEVILKLCEPSRNTQSLDNTQEIRSFFHQNGIEWIQRYSKASQLANLDMSSYELFIIDLKLNEPEGVTGWQLVTQIRNMRASLGLPAPIWILSRYSFFALPAQTNYHIQHFFSKNESGYNNLLSALQESFFPYEPLNDEPSLNFKDMTGKTYNFPVSQIISIQIKNRCQFLYYCSSKHNFSHKFSYPTADLFHDALKQIEDKHIQNLIRISYGVIINADYIENIKGANKHYRISLFQNGILNEHEISYVYLKKVKDYFGDPLPTFDDSEDKNHE